MNEILNKKIKEASVLLIVIVMVLSTVAVSADTMDKLENDGNYVNPSCNQNMNNGNKDVTATFKEDTIPPVTNCTLDPPEPDGDNGWYVSCVNVTLVATDEGSGVESTWYRLDDGYQKLYTGQFEVCEEGYHTLKYYSIDNAGNREDPPKIAEFKIDIKPPVTTHEFDGFVGDNDWYVSDVIVTLSATDVASGVNYTMYSVDRGEWYQYVDPFVVSDCGEHIVRFYSVDYVGNVEDTNDADFKIDQTDPTIELTWDEDNYLLIADVYDETSGVAKVEFYVNYEYIGEATEYPYEWNVPDPESGDTGYAIVYDNAGNNVQSDVIDAVPQGTSISQSRSSSSTLVQSSTKLDLVCSPTSSGSLKVD